VPAWQTLHTPDDAVGFRSAGPRDETEHASAANADIFRELKNGAANTRSNRSAKPSGADLGQRHSAAAEVAESRCNFATAVTAPVRRQSVAIVIVPVRVPPTPVVVPPMRVVTVAVTRMGVREPDAYARVSRLRQQAHGAEAQGGNRPERSASKPEGSCRFQHS
jgi:hypothetical protein